MSNRAVVVDPEAPGRLVIREVADPVPDRGEAVVRLKALSLNRGEVRRAGMAASGWRPVLTTRTTDGVTSGMTSQMP